MGKASQGHRADQFELLHHWLELQGLKGKASMRSPRFQFMGWVGWHPQHQPYTQSHIPHWKHKCRNMGMPRSAGLSNPPGQKTVKPVCNGFIQATSLHFSVFGSVISPSHRGKRLEWKQPAPGPRMMPSGEGSAQNHNPPQSVVKFPCPSQQPLPPKPITPSSSSPSTKLIIRCIPSPSNYLFI